MKSNFKIGEKVAVIVTGELPCIGEVTGFKKNKEDPYPIIVKVFDDFISCTLEGRNSYRDSAPSLFKLTKENVTALNILYGTNLKTSMSPKDICKAMFDRGDKYVIAYDGFNDCSDSLDGDLGCPIILMGYNNIVNGFVCVDGILWEEVIPFNPKTGEALKEEDLHNM